MMRGRNDGPLRKRVQRSTDRAGIINNFNFEASENMSEHCWRGAPAMTSLTSLRSGLPGSRKARGHAMMRCLAAICCEGMELRDASLRANPRL
eukprot:10646259-Alexandrium_andersonii.AAC.1